MPWTIAPSTWPLASIGLIVVPQSTTLTYSSTLVSKVFGWIMIFANPAMNGGGLLWPT